MLFRSEIGSQASALRPEGRGDQRSDARESHQPYAPGHLNKTFTFDTHVEGKSNQLARAAAALERQIPQADHHLLNRCFALHELVLGDPANVMMLGRVSRTGDWRWEKATLKNRFPQVDLDRLIQDSTSDQE